MSRIESEREFPLVDEASIRRFLADVDFPVTGYELVATMERNRAPRDVVRAMQRLTPAKLFHNVFEVWFDADRLQRSG